MTSQHKFIEHDFKYKYEDPANVYDAYIRARYIQRCRNMNSLFIECFICGNNINNCDLHKILFDDSNYIIYYCDICYKSHIE